jgi:hypothetical protein
MRSRIPLPNLLCHIRHRQWKGIYTWTWGACWVLAAGAPFVIFSLACCQSSNLISIDMRTAAGRNSTALLRVYCTWHDSRCYMLYRYPSMLCSAASPCWYRRRRDAACCLGGGPSLPPSCLAPGMPGPGPPLSPKTGYRRSIMGYLQKTGTNQFLQGHHKGYAHRNCNEN